jgi:transcription elongation factor GreB
MENKNYITPAGLAKLRSEYQQLLQVERPRIVETVAWAASNGDRSENADYIYGKRRLREIDSRLRFLSGRMEKADVVDPAKTKSDRVLFGATVTIEDEEGNEATYQIVGEDEIDVPNGKISWRSPIAKSMLGKKAGDEVTVQKPKGLETLCVVQLIYK